MIDDYGYERYGADDIVAGANCIICNNTILIRRYASSKEGLLCGECKKRLNELLYGADMRGAE